MSAERPILRVLVCGSVDDGKSTLIGRLLYDTASVPEDQLAAVAREGPAGLDLSLLTDGLENEREQGITIDVAYRQFRTARRRFMLVDCPGHEQYTRNMATGAAAAEFAVVLVDAAAGVRSQTRRHVAIAKLMGVRAFAGVANKMDTVGFAPQAFAAVATGLRALLGAESPIIPTCAVDGDGVTRAGARMPWYAGPTLLEVLEAADVPGDPAMAFRMPVQWVARDGGSRLYYGSVVAGRIGTGDDVAISDSPPSRIRRILGPTGEQGTATAGQAVVLELADQRDVGRGSLFSAADSPAPVADQFQAHLIWLHDAPLVPGRPYLVKLGARTVPGTVSRIRHALEVDSGLPLSARTLQKNDLAVVNLSLASPVPFERFADCKALGGLILIDRQTNATAGVGMLDFALTRSAHLAWQETTVHKPARARMLGQTPVVVWFTGLSGSGKSTIANLVETRLCAMGYHTYLLDGDNVRHGLCRDLGFTEADRVENIRRVSEVAALMVDAGLIVLVCLISPYRADRQAARERVGPGEFLEVFVDTPIETCRRRDPKGLYAKADQGLIPNFTGVSAPYESPERPDVHIRSEAQPPADGAEIVLSRILDR